MLDVEKTIEDNMDLVWFHLHKHNLGYNEDAMSYAMEALWRAAETFDESNGAKFSTYASTCIYNGIMRYFRESARIAKLDTVSLDEQLNEEGFTIADVLVGDEDISCGSCVAIYDTIRRAIDKLPNEDHRQLIRLWIESNVEVTQHELGKLTGLSQAQVSRIIGIFRNKLKKELEASYDSRSKSY